MARVPTIIQIPRDPAINPMGIAGTQSLKDDNLARGGVLGMGYVPHFLAQDKEDEQAGALDAQYVVFTTNGATDVTVPHRLGRVPRRMTVVMATPLASAAGTEIRAFPGGGVWTDSRVYLRSNTTGDRVTVEIA